MAYDGPYKPITVSDSGIGSFLSSNMDEVDDSVLAFGQPSGINSFYDTAEKMAQMGRGGDGYMVHASEREMMVPREVVDQNPELRQQIQEKIAEAGADPNAYVVGNPQNSINPQTGQREFFLKGLVKGLKKAFKGIVSVVKKLAPIIIPFAINMIAPGLGTVAAGALGGGIATLVQGGSFKDAMKSALVGGAVGGLTAGFKGVLNKEGFMSGVKSYGMPSIPKGESIFAGGYFSDAAKSAATAAGKDSALGNFWERTKFAANYQPTSVAEGGEKVSLTDRLNPKGSADATAARYAKLSSNPAYANLVSTPEGQAKLLEMAQPSMLQKYGGTALAGLGIGAAAGGFNTPEPEDLSGDMYQAVTPEQIENARVGIARTAPMATASDVSIPYSYAQSAPPPVALADYSSMVQNMPQVQLQSPQQAMVGGQMPSQVMGYDRFGNPIQSVYAPQQPTYAARGGEMNKFPRRNGHIDGPGTGTSDSVPAMLSDGEFVMTANAVRNAGNGDRQKGVRKMYDIMRAFEGGVVA
jgi:anti-sigma factor RsiW